MNQLSKMFEGNQLRIIEKDSEPWFVAKDVCDILEIKNASQAVSKLDEDERSMFNIGRQGEVNVVNEFGLYNLVLGSRKPEAKQFKRWVTHEIIPAIRKTGTYSLQEEPVFTHFKKEAYMLEVAANILRLPDSGRLKLLGDFNKEHHLNVPLPSYADEPITVAATDLLKEHDAGIGAQAFNKLMLREGLLEEKERRSSKGSTKLFKSLTDAGLEYGKNIISPANPRETAPHYYPDKFPALLKRLGL